METAKANASIVCQDTAASFLASCGKWLEQNEDVHSGLLTLADALRTKKHIHRPPFHFLHVELNSEIVGCAIFAEPDGLTLSEMSARTVEVLFQEFKDLIRAPSRVFGPRDPATIMAQRFSDLTTARPIVHSEWHIHRIDTPPHHDSTEGFVHRCDAKSEAIIRRWAKAYAAERPAFVDIEEFFIRKMKNGHAYFWLDGEPKSILTVSGVNCKGVRISSVFTPSRFRGQGYASSLVATITETFLDNEKSFVTLSTEIGDPVEAMYSQLGFSIVGESISVVFDAKTQQGSDIS